MKRQGFTLVELLIVVLIITILATITLFALVNAGEVAKQARTKAQIAKIHSLLMPLWESYLTRRPPVATATTDGPAAAAQKRVDAMRELIRFELPDRISDVITSEGNYAPPARATLTGYPALSEAYRRRANTVKGATGGNWSIAQQNAECLYLILACANSGDTSNLESFRDDEFGDVDKDQMREIVDGWGTPIRFLRWAPGYVGPYSTLHDTTKPDEFDPLGIRGTAPANFALFPLVISAGADKAFDIMFDDSNGAINYGATSPPNNPYADFSEMKIGSIVDNDGPSGLTDGVENHGDNITNHLSQ